MVNTMLVIRLVRSKLRKREDHTSSVVAPSDVILHTTATEVQLTATGSATSRLETAGRFLTFTSDTAFVTQVAADSQQPSPSPQFHGLWQYPPQYSLYSTDKETLVQPMPVGRQGFARGLKKNLSGRWKRLVKKKPTNEVYTIPPDLRDQLKTIYVY